MKRCNDCHLYSTPNGAVYNSCTCGNVVVDFGNMLVIIQEESFYKLKKLVMETPREDIDQRIVEPFDKVVLQPSEFMGYYVFKKEEFIELQELISGAASILNMKKEIMQCIE